MVGCIEESIISKPNSSLSYARSASNVGNGETARDARELVDAFAYPACGPVPLANPQESDESGLAFLVAKKRPLTNLQARII